VNVKGRASTSPRTALGRANERAASPRMAIEDASSWILRVGVIASLAVMFAGLVGALVGGAVSVQSMENRPFSADFPLLLRGVAARQPFSLMELGVVLLVLTPILRVFTAMVLFASGERDRLYTAVTSLVLALTVASLLFIK
jgi:uncharacterized membrane protein